MKHARYNGVASIKQPTLEKCSAPGWTKQFDTDEELATELARHVCSDCKDTINNSSSIPDLLSTCCGLEFDYYES